MRLQDCKLFKNTRIDIERIEIRDYPNNYSFAMESDISKSIGIVLEGRVLIKAYSLGGNNFTLNTIDEGQIFGDILIFSNEHNTFPGTLITQGKTKIALIPNNVFEKFLFNDNDLLRNFLRLLSDKSYALNYKSRLLGQDSVRDKILFYLFHQRRIQNNKVVKLNMTKEELANQLFVQRPSLSRELARMKRDGLIDYDRYTITIKK
ncbi:MAG: Crp/Fnr family transcriptional regulator [Candidatus Izimaplasma sp.]|nr:Crp/Fnr family transcriptional regulator [Candidatus Izimaplasma bacterium]